MNCNVNIVMLMLLSTRVLSDVVQSKFVYLETSLKDMNVLIPREFILSRKENTAIQCCSECLMLINCSGAEICGKSGNLSCRLWNATFTTITPGSLISGEECHRYIKVRPSIFSNFYLKNTDIYSQFTYYDRITVLQWSRRKIDWST